MPSRDDGFALILVLVMTMAVMAIGAAMLTMADIEVVSESNHRDGLEALYAAEAALDATVAELSAAPDWTFVLSGAVSSRFVDATTRPVSAVAGPLDLVSLTASVQALSDARPWWGANQPRWKLFSWGAFDRLVPVSPAAPGPYLVVWVSDDEAESDGNSWSDQNGMVRVRAEAHGRRGSRRIVEAVVARTAQPGVVRLASWREG